MIEYMLHTIDPRNAFKTELKALFADYPSIDTAAMGFPVEWEEEPLWK